MATRPTIHPGSFLGRMCAHQPLITSAGKELLRRIPFLWWDGHMGGRLLTHASLVSVDNGNDALKGAIRGGEGVTTWQVNDSEPFWIGEDAIFAKKAETLPIGFTEERLPDERYERFLFASLVELLRGAGYGTHAGEFQGEHDLSASFGIPNEEMTQKGPKETVRHALRAISNTTSTIRRTDEQGQTTTWSLRQVETPPYPQSFASFATWYYTLDGTPIETDIVRHITLDIGGGQFHDCNGTCCSWRHPCSVSWSAPMRRGSPAGAHQWNRHHWRTTHQGR